MKRQTNRQTNRQTDKKGSIKRNGAQFTGFYAGSVKLRARNRLYRVSDKKMQEIQG